MSPFCYYFISVIKHRLGLDDALDAFGCHGIGGIFGGIMTGIFADPAVNHQTGLLYGGTELFIAQIISIVFTILLRGHIFSIDPCDQTRATDPGLEQEEAIGMDRSEHDETAYPTFMGLDS